MYKLEFSFQESICGPSALDCYKEIDPENNECLPPCEGLFASVVKLQNFKPDAFEILEKSLYDYKKFRNKDFGMKNFKYTKIFI